jgi:transcriptional regulator with XRE-family HTH domain
MPKIPANPHPLHLVRKELGWTQQKLAEKCGVAAVTIKKIEGRSLKPSIDLLGRIMWATGVDPESLSADKPTIMKLPYTGELGNGHITAVRTSKLGEIDVGEHEIGIVGDWATVLGVVMMAAAKKNAFHTVGFLFQRWAESVIADFGLGQDILRVPSDKGSKLERIQKSVKSRKKAKR